MINLYKIPLKYKFDKKELNFLILIIKFHKIHINLYKIQIIKNLKTFTNIKELLLFLNFVIYNKNFINKYFYKDRIFL